MQHAWWFDGCVPSPTTVARFKAAHTKATAAAGFEQARIDAEQLVFDTPMVWKLPTPKVTRKGTRAAVELAGVTVEMHPSVMFTCNATRFAVSNLSREDVMTTVQVARSILSVKTREELADALTALPHFTSPAHKGCIADVLTFVLNAPRVCDAFVYCQSSDECCIAISNLRLEAATVDSLGRSLMAKPTEEQKCLSRLVCFWCGSSPLSTDVALSVCAGCRCVAYCSASCQTEDWNAEHHRECKRKSASVSSESGLTSLPPTRLSITRVTTEVTKPTSMRVALAVDGPRNVGLTRICCLDKSGAPQLIPMAWTAGDS